MGEPIQLAPSIGSFLDYPFFSVSETTWVYREPEPPYQPTWFDRDGAETGRVGAPEWLAGLTLSPGDDRVLVVRHAPESTADQDLWLHDLTRGSYQRMTTAPTLVRGGSGAGPEAVRLAARCRGDGVLPAARGIIEAP